AAPLTVGGPWAAQTACVALYNGQWTGVGHSTDQDLDFTLLADIAFTDDQLVGFMRVFGDVTVEGSFVGTVDCATFSATFDSPASHFTVEHLGEIAEDGRTITSRYAFDEGGPLEDHGEFLIEVGAAPQAASVGDVEIWEGGTSDTLALARVQAAAVPKPKPRTATLPVTMSEPAAT